MHCYTVNVHRYVYFIFRFGVPCTGPKQYRIIADSISSQILLEKNEDIFFFISKKEEYSNRICLGEICWMKKTI